MTIKISGDNSTSSPAIQGSDSDSGLRVDGNNIDNVIDGQQRLRIDGAGIQVLRPVESFSQIRRTGSVGDNDYIGAVSWKAENSGGATEYEYAKINTQIKDVTAGTENSRFIVETRNDGTMHSSFELENGVHSFPRLPWCIAGQNGGWISFSNASYGILPSNGAFFNNNADAFYAGSDLNGYKVIHARHAGTYLFLLTAYMNSAWDARLIINRNNSHQIGFVEGRTGSNDHTSSVTAIDTLGAGDYVNYSFVHKANGQIYTGDNHTHLSIVKIG